MKTTVRTADRTIFTTGQIAKICKVAPRTVSKWFDSGRLRGYRIPGSQDRRVPREHLVRFLTEHGMPLGELENADTHNVLFVGLGKPLEVKIVEAMQGDEFRLAICPTSIEAGLAIPDLNPDCVVIDFAMGRQTALSVVQALAARPEYSDLCCIGLVSDDDNAAGFDRTIFTETFRKPFDVALLVERIRSLVLRRKKQLAGMA